MSQFRVMSWNVENLFDVGDEDGPRIDDNPNERIGEPGSDHAAVIATFDF